MARKSSKLGEILLESGLLNEPQLEKALLYQRDSGCKLGKAAIMLGFVSEEKLLNSLAGQLGIDLLKLGHRTIPDSVLSYLPYERARQYHAIPVDGRDIHGCLYLMVAMSDPANLVAIDDLQFLTGCRIAPALAAEADIEQAIERFYGSLEERKKRLSTRSTENRIEVLEKKYDGLVKVLKDKEVLTLDEFHKLK